MEGLSLVGVMTDVSLDIETSGTDPEHSGILQIGAIKFNYDTGEIGEAFNRCLWLAPDRTWDEDTRAWWGKHPEVLTSIHARAEDPTIVLKDFVDWCGHGLRLWAKPVSFELPFLSSHFRQFSLPNPFHYRYARDLNSFLAGLYGTAEHQWMKHVEFDGNPHDGLDDACFQLKVLLTAKEENVR